MIARRFFFAPLVSPPPDAYPISVHRSLHTVAPNLRCKNPPPSTTDHDVSEPLPETFLGRQPILDRQQATIGYELLFRATARNEAEIISATAATADVVCKAFAEIGLANALGDQRAFVNIDEDFLCDDAVELLPQQTVTLELNEATLSERTVQRALQLMTEGYEFCLSGITTVDDPWCQALSLASWIKIAADMPENALGALIKRMAGSKCKLIASRVETPEDFRRCHQLGFRKC